MVTVAYVVARPIGATRSCVCYAWVCIRYSILKLGIRLSVVGTSSRQKRHKRLVGATGWTEDWDLEHRRISGNGVSTFTHSRRLVPVFAAVLDINSQRRISKTVVDSVYNLRVFGDIPFPGRHNEHSGQVFV